VCSSDLPDVEERGNPMGSLLKWAVIFLIISLVAGLFGFFGISQGAADISQVLFFIVLMVFVLFIVLGVLLFKPAA